MQHQCQLSTEVTRIFKREPTENKNFDAYLLSKIILYVNVL